MIRKSYLGVVLLAGVLVGLVASGRIAIHAQERGAVDRGGSSRSIRSEPVAEPRPEAERGPNIADGEASSRRATRSLASASVQDVLLRPFHFSFNRPTALTQVCLQLKQSLGVPVVLDLAALERQDVEPDDTVQLELDGVRLKTGLKLLLDQVGLTYHVLAEDNLLVITDRQGSEDPLDRIWTELRTLHRDIHEVQDAVDELSDALYADTDEGPRVRKPTIIEEKPDRDPFGEVPDGLRDRTEKPGRRPGAAEGAAPPPATAPRSTPGRVPLSRKHRVS